MLSSEIVDTDSESVSGISISITVMIGIGEAVSSTSCKNANDGRLEFEAASHAKANGGAKNLDDFQMLERFYELEPRWSQQIFDMDGDYSA